VLSEIEKTGKLLDKEKSAEKPVEKPVEKIDKTDKQLEKEIKPERLSRKEKSKTEKPVIEKSLSVERSSSVDKSSSVDRSNSDDKSEVIVDLPAALASLTLDNLFDELNKIKEEEDCKRAGKPLATFSLFGRKLVLVKK